MNLTTLTTRILPFLALTLLGCAASQPRPTTPQHLDGRTYPVQLVTGSRSFPSTLSFTRGQFDSTACRRFGYTWAPYQIERQGDALLVRVHAESNRGGIHTWQATITGDHIEGTLRSVERGQPVVVYSFQGTAH